MRAFFPVWIFMVFGRGVLRVFTVAIVGWAFVKTSDVVHHSRSQKGECWVIDFINVVERRVQSVMSMSGSFYVRAAHTSEGGLSSLFR